MGLGIAQLGAVAGMHTVLYDPDPAALERALEAIGRDLAAGVTRGRLTEADAEAARDRLQPTGDLADLADRELIIEAVPERLELKAELLQALPADAILATNTSSLSVTAIAAAAARPERVVGMHFFNPPTRMKLVEVVAGLQTAPDVVKVAHDVVAAMGRTAIDATDDIGFLVNRCGRPFYSEAVALLDEGLATPAEIDRICRVGAGFRMGPFELMDLIGVDTNLAVMRSFAAQSYGEPRWKPSTAQHRLVAAGRLGRKSGRGWYAYGDEPHRADDPEPPAGHGGTGRRIAIVGRGAEADALRACAIAHGFLVGADPDRPQTAAVLAFGAVPPQIPAGVPLLVDCAARTLASTGAAAAFGFHVLPPAADATLLELTRGPAAEDAHADALEALAADLGLHHAWIDDAPGLVLGRLVSQLVNEAAFAVGGGIGSAEDVDLGLRLGLNHPRGAVAWGARIGLRGVLARLDGLWQERRDPRYRAAPLLRRAAALDVPLGALRPHGKA